MSDVHEAGLDDAVAIVGMAGRFPGAKSVDAFWSNVKDGVSSISIFTDDELETRPDTAARSDEATAQFVRAKGILHGIELFDARFFGYVPREAELMDPQHRLFLECAWEALESAGWNPDRYDGNIGVFAGCYMDTYLLANLCADPRFLRQFVDSIQVGSLQTELGNDKDYLATRVSFKLNLRGPSVTVQTACSTSLVAIAQACQSVMTYQSDMALAGGVTVTLPQRKGYFYKEGGMLSPDGTCRAFSDEARGTVFSNGVGVVLLKRLSDALEEGDTIHAVIRGWALNNDGGEKLSYTAPSVAGQAEVISTAQAMAGLSARTIGYIEAHGTATPLGDPIEVDGLTRAFRETTDDNGFCALGSVKTNLGHLDVASGVIGTIKTALALRDGILPPSLNFERPNPNIPFEETPFYVNTELREWPGASWPRRAGVSSFGVGGTNAHIVLEQPPEPPAETTDGVGVHVLPLSARSPEALAAMSERLADALESADVALADVAFTLQEGRRRFEERRIVTGRTLEDLTGRLRARGRPQLQARTAGGRVPVSFLFPGQGSQYPSMGRALYDSDPLLRERVDACFDAAPDGVGATLRSALYPEALGPEEQDAVRRTEAAQPLLYTVEYALGRRWIDAGIVPEALIGHSIGEFAAAALAGIFSPEDGMRAVVERGRLMQAMPPGRMLSVRAAAETVHPILPDGVEIAAVNAPDLCVVSGAEDSIRSFAERLDGMEVDSTVLHTSHAFHSASMEPAAEQFTDFLRSIPLSAPSIPLHSTATGRLMTAAEATDPEYWGRQLRHPVLFADALLDLVGSDAHVLLEVGPGQALTALGTRVAGDLPGVRLVPTLGPARDPGDDEEAWAEALGRLWLSGAEVPWSFAVGTGRRVPLPTYPFERKRFWVDPPDRSAVVASGRADRTGDGSDSLEELLRRQMDVMRKQLGIMSGN